MSGPAWNEALVIAGGIHCALFAVFHLLAVVVVLSFACAYGAQVLGVGGPKMARLWRDSSNRPATCEIRARGRGRFSEP